MQRTMSEILESGDGRLAWTRYGSGSPLLMVNGYAATGADWDPMLLGKLARDFTLLCPDNRGMGGSDLGEKRMTIAHLAADQVALLDALEIERADVAGWSMGGFVAQELAAAHPERVGNLVLLATDPGGPDAVLGGHEEMARLYDHGGTPREQATRLISLLFPPGVAEDVDAQFGEAVAEARAALSAAALTAQEEAMHAWYEAPASPRLEGIRAPTLVMAGERDVVIPAVNSEALAASISSARLERFPGAGHAFIAQEAPAVASLIRDFLREP
jgi:3-oxoadipate enol-lactonase